MPPGTLTVATAEGGYEYPKPPESAKSSWRRRGLADWIASSEIR